MSAKISLHYPGIRGWFVGKAVHHYQGPLTYVNLVYLSMVKSV